MDFFTNNIIQHLGYIFTFLALSIKDVLWLRITLMVAQIILGVYQSVIGRYDVVFWNFIFTCVNLYHIIRIYNERKPVQIPSEIKDLYAKIFNNMTTKEFLYFWNLGKYYTQSNTTIIKEGEKQENLYLILEGTASVTRNSKEVVKLARGDFIAEMSLITQEPASADVQCNNDFKYIIWGQDQLRHFQTSNQKFWMKLNQILSRDLIKKVKG